MQIGRGMNKTRELVWKIREAVVDGRMAVRELPVEDIVHCVYTELELYQNTISQTQYLNILESFQRLQGSICEEMDLSKSLLWLDAMLLCLDMLSDTI